MLRNACIGAGQARRGDIAGSQFEGELRDACSAAHTRVTHPTLSVQRVKTGGIADFPSDFNTPSKSLPPIVMNQPPTRVPICFKCDEPGHFAVHCKFVLAVYNSDGTNGKACPACKKFMGKEKIRKMATGAFMLKWIHDDCALREIATMREHA